MNAHERLIARSSEVVGTFLLPELIRANSLAASSLVVNDSVESFFPQFHSSKKAKTALVATTGSFKRSGVVTKSSPIFSPYFL